MPEDRYRVLRELPFPVLAQALGADISKYRLRKGGTEYSGPCLVHRPKRNTTSFSYNVDGRFSCFSCGAKGRGCIDLSMQVRGVGFQEAVNGLQPYVGSAVQHRASQVPEPHVRVVTEMPTENPPFRSTYEKFFKPHPWLAERGLESSTLERFGVGFYENPTRRSAYNGSVMLKIRRYSDGETVGYLSRNIGEITPEKPKYRFPEGLHKSLEVYGAFELKEDHPIPLRVIYVAESPFTVLKFHQLGLPCVAAYGWSVSQHQADIISQLAKGVIYLPDRDKHAQAASAVHELAKRLWCKCPELPVGIDDPEYLKAEQVKALA